MTASQRDFLDGLIAVALYFAVCAMTSDAHAAHLKEPTMNTATAAPEATSAEIAITWRHHAEPPEQPVRAIIAIEPFAPELFGHQPFLLPELYDWDTIEGYWVSASSRLRIRHKDFRWASTDTLLRSVP